MLRSARQPGADALAYRASLPAELGLAGVSVPAATPVAPELAWAASGALPLCGHAGAPPVVPQADVAGCADAVVDVLGALAASDNIVTLVGSRLLGERAALTGGTRNGRTSVGGSARLLRAADGWLCLNLARTDDVELLPAWLERDDADSRWPWLEGAVRELPAARLVARARELGMAAASVGDAGTPHRRPWMTLADRGRAAAPPTADARPLVLDLSSLWAGPLCGNLLTLAGARVIKVESTRRLDGARRGNAAFFDLLNAGKESVALDFRDPADVGILRRLIERADILIEASRPRALEQLGIDAAAEIRRRPGLSWISITGYGRDAPGRDWVAFGDDAATSLCTVTGGKDGPMFCADAVADPLAGMHAALAAWVGWRLGGGRLLDVSMSGVVQGIVERTRFTTGARVTEGSIALGERTEPIAAPTPRAARGSAAGAGDDTRRIIAEFAASC